MSDLHKCQTCKQDVTQTEFGRLKGGLSPQCKRCRSLYQRNYHYRKRNPIARRNSRPSFFSVNLRAFEDISEGGYQLTYKGTGKPEGLIGLQGGVVFLQIRFKRYLLEENHVVIADFLANKGFVISSKKAKLPLDAFEGEPRQLEELLTPTQSDYSIKLWAKMRAHEL